MKVMGSGGPPARFGKRPAPPVKKVAQQKLSLDQKKLLELMKHKEGF